MPRVTVQLPEQFVYSTRIPVLIGHINYGNHLDNGALLGLVSEARVRFFKSLGYTELNVEGAGIIVADAAVQYRSEAFHGETLTIEMTPADFAAHGCDLVWRIREATSGREVARGKTGIVFFDYAARRKLPVPDAFRARTGG